MTDGKTTEGWWRPWNGRRWHYIVDGRSLCRRWGYLGDGATLRPHTEATADADDCQPCARIRTTREQNR